MAVNPLGSVSVKPTPLRAVVFAAGLPSTNVSDVEPFSGMLLAVNAFEMVGGPTTVKVALAVFPAPPFAELACTELLNVPAEVACTFADTTQLAPGARLAPVRLTVLPAATAVPLHVVERLFDAATTMPEGRESVNETLFSVRFELLLETVMLSKLTPPSNTLLGANALATPGGLITVRLAEAAMALPAAVELRVALLLNTPSVVPTTFTLIVQAPTASEELLYVMLVAPAFAVTVPPQPFETDGDGATCIPAGRASVKFASMPIVFPLVRTKLSVEAVLGVTVVGLNALVMDGGCRTKMAVVTVTPSKVAEAELVAPADPAW